MRTAAAVMMRIDHHDAEGFINLFGLSSKVRAMKFQEIAAAKAAPKKTAAKKAATKKAAAKKPVSKKKTK